MSSWFGDAFNAAQDQQDEEEKLRQLQAQANAGDVPVAAPQAFYGTPPPAPPSNLSSPSAPGPGDSIGQITPAEPWWTSASAQNLLSAPAYTGDTPTPAPNYTGTYGPAFNITPQEIAAQQAASTLGELDPGPFGIGNHSPLDLIGVVGNLPAVDFLPGGTALNAGLNLAGVNTPTLGEAYNTRIPVVSDFMENKVQPFVGQVGATAAQITDPFGVGSTLSQQFGGPTAPEVGRFGGEGLVPVTVGDFALNALAAPTGAGALERLTGLPLDDIVRSGARAVGDYAIRDLVPPPMAFERNAGRDALSQVQFPSIAGGAPTPPINPRGGENVFGEGARGGWREALPPTTDLEGDLRRSLEALGITPPPPSPPAFPERYPSIPEGTMGELFPDVVREQGLNPNSPAARMGAPLAYDPQFMTPPPADAAMRAAGVAPEPPNLADEMRNAFERNRALEGGAVSGQPPAISLPPAEGVTAPPVSGVLPERTATRPDGFTLVGEPFDTPRASVNSRRIDDLIREAQAPPQAPSFPMTPEEAVATADRIGFPINRDALERGTPLAKQEEMDRLSAAIDLENFKRTSSTERDAWENWIRANREADVPRPPGSPPGAPPHTPPPGGYPPGVNTPQSRSIYDNLMDAAYSFLSGDVGTPFRQDITGTFNITNLALNRDVYAAAARMASSRDEALKVLNEFNAIKQEMADKLGKPIKFNEVDIPGIRESKGFANREIGQSQGFGRIPVVGAYFNVTGRANAGVLEARRVLATQRFVDNLPNRALAGAADQAKMAARAQSYADMMSVFSGRGNLGGGKIEQALSKAGPIFTSLRNAASIPERVPYLLPLNKIADGSWELFGPQWREAVREQAGFAATLGATLLAAHEAGVDVDFDKGTLKDATSKAARSTFDLTGGAGQYWSTIQRMAAGDLMAGAEFARNKVGPLPQVFVQGVQASGLAKGTPLEGVINFLRPEWWNQGATGSGSLADRIAAAIVPLWMQDVAKTLRYSGGDLKTAGEVGAASFAGINARTNELNPRTVAVNQVMGKPENLAGLPPNVAAFLQDKSWNEATPKEQQAILAKLSPEDRAAIEKGEAALREKKDVFQLNRDEARARQQLADEQRGALKPLADQAFRDWQTGNNPEKAIETIKRVEARADKEAQFTANVGPKLSESAAYQNAVKGLPTDKTDAQKEVDRIREIQGKYYGIYDDPRVARPDGTKDWDKINAAQKAIIDTVRAKDPGFATRIEFNLQKNPENDFDLTKWISKIDDRLDKAGYYNVPSGGKTQFAREHPDVDALVSAKYGSPVHSEKAAQILTSLLPERKVVYAR